MPQTSSFETITMTISAHYVGDNSSYLTIGPDTALVEVIASLSNYLQTKGWTCIDPVNLVYRALNQDRQSYKYVRLATMPDPDAPAYWLGSLVVKTNSSSEETDLAANGIGLNKLNWFKLTSATTFELWMFANPRWLLLTSKEGQILGRGVINTTIATDLRVQTTWQSRYGFYGNVNDTPDGDYITGDRAYYLAVLSNNNSCEFYHDQVKQFYYDKLDPYTNSVEYTDYQNIQGCVEFARSTEGDTVATGYPAYFWFGSAYAGDHEDLSYEAQDISLNAKQCLNDVIIQSRGAKAANTLGICPLTKSSNGDSQNASMFACNTIEPLSAFMTAQYARANFSCPWTGLNFIQDVEVRDNWSYRGKCYGLKLGQANTETPFGELVSLKVDNNFALSANGSFKQFIRIPGYVTKKFTELSRHWLDYGQWLYLPSSHITTINPCGEHGPEPHSAIWVCGAWEYYQRVTTTATYGSFFIPA